MEVLEQGILRHREGVTYGSLEHVTPLIMLSGVALYFSCGFNNIAIIFHTERKFGNAPSLYRCNFSKTPMPPSEEKFCLYEFLFIGPTLQAGILSKGQHCLTMEVRPG